MKLKEKYFFARTNRHAGECYHAVPVGEGLAYLAVEGTRETLMVKANPNSEPIALTDATYILSPHCTGRWLTWVEQVGKRWRLRGVSIDTLTAAAVSELIPTTGRPLALSSWEEGDTTWLVWEERFGKKTQVFIAICREGEWGAPLPVSRGTFNAYDPAVCITTKGEVMVAYGAFVKGNYRIRLQRCGPDGRRQGEPIRLGSQALPCAYPSLAPTADGGVWFAYATFGGEYFEHAFLQHGRFIQQRLCFSYHSQIYVGLFRDGRTWAPFAPPTPQANQGLIAATIAYGADHGTHNRLLVDSTGRVDLLFHRYADGAPLAAEKEDTALNRSENRGATNPRQNHPGLWHMRLDDRGWSEANLLSPRMHLDHPIQLLQKDKELTIAITEDGRRTGWSVAGEWFDGVGQLGVGLLKGELPSLDSPTYELHPYVVPPRDSARIENPKLPLTDNHGLRPVVGQTHTHTNLSVCARSGDRDGHFNYRYMQDVQHSDFGAITDHAYNLWHTEMLMVRKLAEYYYVPGEFVAFPAYEWTGSCGNCRHEGGPWGHVNPLWLEEEGDHAFYTPTDPTCPGGSLLRLWKAYQGQKVVTPPHHVADKLHPYNWDVFNETFEPVIEIFQDLRGSGEQPWAPGVTNNIHAEKGNWALLELMKGKRFGFIAGADHTGIARAGLWVKELTRAGLYEAFMQRRTFATTGATFHLDFTANGAPQGSAVKASEATFVLKATAGDPIDEIQIVCDGEQIETIEVTGLTCTHKWTATRQRNGEFWYCRVICENGEMAWTSPIWLDE